MLLNIARERCADRMLAWGERAAEVAFELRIMDGWVGSEMTETVSRSLSQQQNPNRFEPIEKPGLDLREKDEVKSKRPSHDGPFLELDLKGIAGTLIDRPRRSEDRPDHDRLAFRLSNSRMLRYSGANGTS